MAKEKRGTITSSDDGTQVPDSNGFHVSGPFTFMITNGTTLSAALQINVSGNWVTLPDSSGQTSLSGAASFNVDLPKGGNFRINVTTATGTWDWLVIE